MDTTLFDMYKLPSFLTVEVIPACEEDCPCGHPEAIVNAPWNGPFGSSFLEATPGPYFFPS